MIAKPCATGSTSAAPAGATSTGVAPNGVERFFELIAAGRQRQASDLHVEPGVGCAYRIYTVVERIATPAFGASDVLAFLDATVDKLVRARLERLGMGDAVYADETIGAIRIHVSQGKRGPRLAIRLLARSIPELQSLRLPAIVEKFSELRSGLVLVTGPTVPANRRPSPRSSTGSTQRHESTS